MAECGFVVDLLVGCVNLLNVIITLRQQRRGLLFPIALDKSEFCPACNIGQLFVLRLKLVPSLGKDLFGVICRFFIRIGRMIRMNRHHDVVALGRPCQQLIELAAGHVIGVVYE